MSQSRAAVCGRRTTNPFDASRALMRSTNTFSSRILYLNQALGSAKDQGRSVIAKLDIDTDTVRGDGRTSERRINSHLVVGEKWEDVLRVARGEVGSARAQEGRITGPNSTGSSAAD